MSPPRKPRDIRQRREARERAEKSGGHGTVLAMVAVLLVTAALLGIAAVVLPGVFLLPAIGGGFAVLIGLQYLLWGYWFDKALHAGSQPESDDEPVPQPPLNATPYADEFRDITG